jgi:Sigma-70, region 4
MIPAQERDLKRDHGIVAMYRGGFTLQKIGDAYGVSRERVRQIVERNGLKRCDGGKHVELLQKKRRKREFDEAWCVARFDCTLTELKEIRAVRANLAYGRQRRSAAARGIEWAFSLGQWWRIWKESGKWNLRGRFRGQYVMARFGDIGPYAPDNVEIKTCSENVKEVRSRERQKRETLRARV